MVINTYPGHNPFMTLDYLQVKPPPPSKAGVMVWGVLTLLLAAFLLLGTLINLVSMAITDTGYAMFVRMGFNLLIVAGLGWMGYGMVRYQRWVRPVVLAVTLLTAKSVFLSLATSFILLPMMGFQSWVVMLTVTFTVIGILIPMAAFLHFLSRGVADTFNHYDLQPRWTDRWPTPVVGLAFAAIISGTFSLLELPTPLSLYLAISQSYLPALFFALILLLASGVTLYAGFTCLKNARRGWKLCLLAVVINGLSPAGFHLIVPDYQRTVANQMTASFSTRSTTTSTVRTSSINLTESASPITFVPLLAQILLDVLLLMLLRRHLTTPPSTPKPPPFANQAPFAHPDTPLPPVAERAK